MDPVSGSPRLIEAQKTKHTITDGQGHPLRISLHPALRPAALSVPGAWVDSVSKLEGGSDLVAHTIFSVSLRKGTRRVLDHPLEWALLWAVPADQPLAFWVREHEHLSPEEERRIVLSPRKFQVNPFSFWGAK